jgi:hypothetical protein
MNGWTAVLMTWWSRRKTVFIAFKVISLYGFGCVVVALTRGRVVTGAPKERCRLAMDVVTGKVATLWSRKDCNKVSTSSLRVGKATGAEKGGKPKWIVPQSRQ